MLLVIYMRCRTTCSLHLRCAPSAHPWKIVYAMTKFLNTSTRPHLLDRDTTHMIQSPLCDNIRLFATL